MRRIIAAALALAVVPALLCACGRTGQFAEPTAATGQPWPVTTAAASKKAAVPAAADAASEPTTTAAKPTTTAKPATTAATATTITNAGAITVNSAIISTTAPAAPTTMPTVPTTVSTAAPGPTMAFGGATIVQAVPGRGIAESLSKVPRTVYAFDMAGQRFLFQPRSYSADGGFVVDVYLEKYGGYAWVDRLASGVLSGGRHTIVLLAPDSEVTADQGGKLLEDVHRFELSVADMWYTASIVAAHRPSVLTSYYALDSEKLSGGIYKFIKITP